MTPLRAVVRCLCQRRRLGHSDCPAYAGRPVLHSGCLFLHGCPFGGYKQSGNGREWGEHGMDEYMETKAIICS
ncbi:aldehyde dehydrogenase family protein [Aliamphritea spongicola]